MIPSSTHMMRAALLATFLFSAQPILAQQVRHGDHTASSGAPKPSADTAKPAPTRRPEIDALPPAVDHDMHSMSPTDRPAPQHDMWMQSLGGRWQLMGMGQVFPTMTTGSLWREKTLLNAAGLYATQPALMADIMSPGARVVLRTTVNLEAWTQREGELTYGGWGEGFIDSRHPHTMLHEAMLTANWWNVAGGALSISAGKGFAPYGTDDPMSRPAVKFPTNHHLSQVLERWTANAAYLYKGWGFEAGAFGGAEPDGPYDLRNIESFADSWSARLSKRLGDGIGPAAAWELSASHASIAEEHHGAKATTRLYNTAVRHAQPYAKADVYALVEGSLSDPDRGKGHYSLLAETKLGFGSGRRHAPYARIEYATRPEYERLGLPGTPDFFRYDHDSHEIGATRWVVTTLGYGYTASRGIVSARPYVELQHNRVSAERGGIDPNALYGARNFWTLSAGARVFLGGGPMRMGGYGVLDPMAPPTTSKGPHARH